MRSANKVIVDARWANQVLRERGIPSPGVEAIAASVEACTSEDRHRLKEILLQVERGTESTDNLQWVLDVLKRANEAGAPITKAKTQTKKDAGPVASEADFDSATPSPEHRLSREVPNENGGRAGVNRAKIHIYGGKAALTVELDTLRLAGENGEAVYSLVIEAAPAIGERRYDWKRKIPFQLTRKELPLLACSLLGLLTAPLTLKNHGPEANKTLVIVNQGATLFVKISQASHMLAVPVQAFDVYEWFAVLMQAMKLNSPDLGDHAQMLMLRRVAAMVNQGENNAKA